MSTRASGRGAVADVFGTPRLSRSWYCAVPARQRPSITTAATVNRVPARTAPFSALPRPIRKKRFDTVPGFPLTSKSDAEPPPLRSPSSSWNLHAGGLLWPDVIGQRDRRNEARRRLSPRAFLRSQLNSTKPKENHEPYEPHNQ